jgi:ribosomal protein S6--L-glutamate ligase
MQQGQTTFILGWKEWLALPDLGLPAIKAKVDTGARTSALHAFQIEPFGPASHPMVRFGIHPVPRRPDVQIFCSAPVVGRREITSSNGEKELRYVIATRVAMGDRVWPVEVTLTNRATMTTRMLLGRQAIQEDMFVDPTAAYRQPRLSYKRYRHVPRTDIVRRALRIAVLTGRGPVPSDRRLALAADVRGHVAEVVDPASLRLVFDGGLPGLVGSGGPVGHYDAVLARLDRDNRAHGASVVRQFELMGSVALNSGDALDRLSHPVGIAQVLTRAGVSYRPPADSELEGAEGAEGDADPPRRSRSRVRFLLVGGRVIAALRRTKGAWLDAGDAKFATETALAESAAAALQLGLASVDVAASGDGREVTRIFANPPLATFQSATGVLVAEAIIAEVEARVRSWVQRAPTSSRST